MRPISPGARRSRRFSVQSAAHAEVFLHTVSMRTTKRPEGRAPHRVVRNTRQTHREIFWVEPKLTGIIGATANERGRSPSPQPSPAGRGSTSTVAGQSGAFRIFDTRTSPLPLPAGEGWGEGERLQRIRCPRQQPRFVSIALIPLLAFLAFSARAQTNAPASVAAATALPGALTFFNGDALHGEFLSVTNNRVQWQHSELQGALDFAPANLHRITLTQPRVDRPAAPGQFLVRFHNGDELVGQLLALDADKLLLDTWFGGRLTIQRAALRSLRPLGSNQLVFEGPTGLDGWRTSSFNFGRGVGGFQYKDGAFIANGPAALGRDIKLPSNMRLEFDLQWQGILQLMMTLYSETLQPWGGDGYQFIFNQYNFSLTRLAPNGNQTHLGSVQVLGNNTRNKARLALYVNKAQRSFTLAVDGEPVHTWQDPAEFTGRGTGVVFFQQGNFLSKISKIRVSEWDGKSESSGSTTSTNRPTEDVLELVNKDQVNGKLAAIRDGKASFSTGFAAMEIPLERVQFVELAAPANAATNAPADNDVRLFFADRGHVTLSLAAWEQKKVRGRNASFGDATFTSAAFNQIQFNLARERKPDVDSFDAREP